MNPYERTAEEMKRQSEGPKRFAKGVAEVGSKVLKTTGALALGSAGIAGALAFAPILKRAAPFLNEYIPENLAIKGLSKISPQLGDFVKKAMDSGYDFKEVKKFIGEQVKEAEPAKQNKNIIAQYSPELHQFMENEIAAGRNPIEAGAIAQGDKRFMKAIKKLSKDHKTPWSSIIESVYGTGQKAGAKKSPNQESVEQTPGEQPKQGNSKWAIVEKELKNFMDL